MNRRLFLELQVARGKFIEAEAHAFFKKGKSLKRIGDALASRVGDFLNEDGSVREVPFPRKETPGE
jgi:hypothetical protein